MLDFLDIRTLSFTLVLFCLLYALGIYLTSFGQLRPRPARLLAIALLLEAIGFLLMGMRHWIPSGLSVVLANFLLCSGMVLTQCGLQSLRRWYTLRKKFHISILTLQLFLFYIFTYTIPNVSARIVIVDTLLAVLALGCAWALRNKRGQRMSPARAMSISVFVGFALYMTLRSYWTLHHPSIPDFMNAGSIHALAFLAYLLLVSGKSFGFVWIQNQQANAALREQARTDGLTGVLNRRTLYEKMQDELIRARRHARPLTLLMLDLDHFKRINDQHGHLIGDQALIRLTQCMRRELRQTDLIGRFGGEEFILVLPDADCDKAVEIAERLRESLSHEVINSPKGNFTLTASFGIACYGTHGDQADDLTNAVDNALYRAKANGRNCIEIAPNPADPLFQQA